MIRQPGNPAARQHPERGSARGPNQSGSDLAAPGSTRQQPAAPGSTRQPGNPAATRQLGSSTREDLATRQLGLNSEQSKFEKRILTFLGTFLG